MTYMIQIHNSDDKLTQRKWSDLVSEVNGIIDNYAGYIYFSGGSSINSSTQTMSWVFTSDRINDIKERLYWIKIKRYNQSLIKLLTISNTQEI